MSPQSRDAITAAKRVLSALAEARDPDPAELEKLRRLAPPLAKLPPAELATKVLQLVSEISGDQAAVSAPKERRARVRTRRTGTAIRRA